MKLFTVTLGWLIVPMVSFGQTKYEVISQSQFNSALSLATSGDSIVWLNGTYSNIFMDVTKNGLIVTSQTSGGATFNGASKVEIDGDNVTLSGLQFVGGNIGTDHVIRIWGSDVLITQINIQDYTSYKYLIIDEDSRRTIVSYSNFENRINQADQNILSILVDNEPGYHKVQHCSFKNFAGGGNDEGVEPIRIGVSTQAHLDSRSIVEYCYFTQCDGDGEIISYKAAQNVIRYNTFVDNSKAELVLRHGDDAIVYGNFFINNMGGIRVREGSNHYIFNNYFEGLDRRTIYLQNDPSDPLEDIHIYHNTIISSQEFILGASGPNPPKNVTIANNIFTSPQASLFEDATGTETWIGNLSFGSLGITRPAGLTESNPRLSSNSEGYFQPDSNSPVIGAAQSGYPLVPLFAGMDYDHEVLLDLMKQSRPQLVDDRAVGASEYSSSTLVRPHATADNTGPFYLSSGVLNSVATTAIGSGQIVLDPPGSSFASGTEVTATAVPAEGHKFFGWGGGLSGKDNPKSFTVSSNMQIIAYFQPNILGAEEVKDTIFYPNPVESFLTITGPFADYKTIRIEILGLDGRIIKNAAIVAGKKNSGRVDLKNLPPDVYFFRAYVPHSTGESLVRLGKFVKK